MAGIILSLIIACSEPEENLNSKSSGGTVISGPYYQSKCEYLDNLTINAEIKNGNPTLIKVINNNGIIDCYDSIFGKGFRVFGGGGNYSFINAAATLNISDINKNFNSFTASFYLKTYSNWISVSTWNSAYFKFNIGNLSIWTYNRDENTMGITLNGNNNVSSHEYSAYVFHHIYIIADNNGINGSNDTVRVYVDNELYCKTSEKFNADSTIPNIYLEAFNGDSPHNSYLIIDNIQIWNYVVSENPN